MLKNVAIKQEIHNLFKSEVAKDNKKMGDVLEELILQYLRKRVGKNDKTN